VVPLVAIRGESGADIMSSIRQPIDGATTILTHMRCCIWCGS
jgi:hypothetical protein